MDKLAKQAAEMDVSGRRTRSRGKRGRSENTSNDNLENVASTSNQTKQETTTGRGGRKKKASKKRAVPCNDDVSVVIGSNRDGSFSCEQCSFLFCEVLYFSLLTTFSSY